MSASKIIAISDIHGCRLTLEALLKQLTERELLKTHQLVFCGDYVDRGRNGVGVLEMICELKVRFPETVVLKGNHEQMALGGVVDDSSPISFLNERGAPGWFAFMREMPLYFETPELLFVHGGVPREFGEASELDEETLLWSMGVERGYQGKSVVHGHVAGVGVRQGLNYFAIDSGAPFKNLGQLSAAVFDGGALKQVLSVRTDSRDIALIEISRAG